MAKSGRNYTECAICGRKAYVSLDGSGGLKFTWPEDNVNRLTMLGKFDHVRETIHHTKTRYLPQKDAIQEDLSRIREMEQWTVKAPSAEKKDVAE